MLLRSKIGKVKSWSPFKNHIDFEGEEDFDMNNIDELKTIDTFTSKAISKSNFETN